MRQIGGIFRGIFVFFKEKTHWGIFVIFMFFLFCLGGEEQLDRILYFLLGLLSFFRGRFVFFRIDFNMIRF